MLSFVIVVIMYFCFFVVIIIIIIIIVVVVIVVVVVKVYLDGKLTSNNIVRKAPGDNKFDYSQFLLLKLDNNNNLNKNNKYDNICKNNDNNNKSSFDELDVYEDISVLNNNKEFLGLCCYYYC